MSQEVVALAILSPLEGKEEDCLQVLRELYVLLRRKGYSRDVLYRDSRAGHRLLNLRHWASAEVRQQAQEDPDVHRLWSRLGLICTIETIYEQLDPVDIGP